MHRKQKTSVNCFHLPSSAEPRLQTTSHNRHQPDTHEAPRSKGAAAMPEMKVKKKCGRPRNPLPRHKRASHIDAEKRRREKIIWNLGSLGEFVPKAEGTSGRQSKANVLTTAVEQMKALIDDTKRKDLQLAQLRAEKAEIKAAIEEFQNTLPAGELMEARPSLPEERFNDYILKRDWKYFLFSFIMKPLFRTFDETVDGRSQDSCKNTVWKWARENMGLQNLRITATDRMATFNKQTDFANKSGPHALQEKIEQLMAEMSRQRPNLLGGQTHNPQVSPLRDGLSSLSLGSPYQQHGFSHQHQQLQLQSPTQGAILQPQTSSGPRGRQARKRASPNADASAGSDGEAGLGVQVAVLKRGPSKTITTTTTTTTKKSRARRTPTPPNMPRTPAHRRVVYTAPAPKPEPSFCLLNDYPNTVFVKTEVVQEAAAPPDPLRNAGSPDSFGSSSPLLPSPCTSCSPFSLLGDLAGREDLGYGTSSSHGSRGNSPPLPGDVYSPFQPEAGGGGGYHSSLFSYDSVSLANYDMVGLGALHSLPSMNAPSSVAACETGGSSSYSDSSLTSLLAANGPSDIFSDCSPDSSEAYGSGAFEVHPQPLGYGHFPLDGFHQEHCLQQQQQPHQQKQQQQHGQQPIHHQSHVQHFKQEPLFPGPSFQDLGVFDMNGVLDDDAVTGFGSHVVDVGSLDVETMAGFGSASGSGSEGCGGLGEDNLSSLWIDTIVSAMGGESVTDLGAERFDIESFLNDSSSDNLPLTL